MFSTSCIFFSHADSCVFSNFSSIRYFLLLCKISHTILFPGTSLFLLNFKVWKHIFKYFFHDRCCYGSSIIYALWVIDNDKSEHFRIVCRCKSQKGCNILICTSWQCLGSRCLSSDRNTFDRGIFSGSFTDYFCLLYTSDAADD